MRRVGLQLIYISLFPLQVSIRNSKKHLVQQQSGNYWNGLSRLTYDYNGAMGLN